jgi:site-specific DNA-methyltransferase (adenine-specific)
VLRNEIPDGSVDLAYIDPPFNSNKDYNQIYSGNGREDVAQSHAFSDTWTWNNQSESYLMELKTNPFYTTKMVQTIIGFENILGKGGMLAYLVSMTIRIAEIWRVLKPTGTFYLHCDSYAGHYLKILCDGIFVDRGGGFTNQIIWCYTSGGVSNKNWAKKHDMILFYTKSKKNYTFNLQKRKVYDSPNLHVTSGKNIPVFEDEKGKYWLANELNWWQIGILSENAKERTGWGTQKPQRLLERIIMASSNAGDVVLDCFCGCGTTIRAAQELNRRWIGIDISYKSISLALEEFEKLYDKDFVDAIAISGVPRDMEAARALSVRRDDKLRKEFETWAIRTYTNNHGKVNDKKGADKGIDGIAYVMGGMVIFSVKSGKVSVKDVRDLRGVVERENAVAGILLSLEEPSKNMLEEAASAGCALSPIGVEMPVQHPKIQIVTIQAIMDGARMTLPLAEPIGKSARRAVHVMQESLNI